MKQDPTPTNVRVLIHHLHGLHFTAFLEAQMASPMTHEDIHLQTLRSVQEEAIPQQGTYQFWSPSPAGLPPEPPVMTAHPIPVDLQLDRFRFSDPLSRSEADPEPGRIDQEPQFTDHESKMRIEAITLIRARTINRLSPTESSFHRRLMSSPTDQPPTLNPSAVESAVISPQEPTFKKKSKSKSKSKKKPKKSPPARETPSDLSNNRDSNLDLAIDSNPATMNPQAHEEQVVPEMASFPPLKPSPTATHASARATKAASKDPGYTYASAAKGCPRVTKSAAQEQEAQLKPEKAPEDECKQESDHEASSQETVKENSPADEEAPPKSAAHLMKESLDAFIVTGRPNKRGKKAKSVNQKTSTSTSVHSTKMAPDCAAETQSKQKEAVAVNKSTASAATVDDKQKNKTPLPSSVSPKKISSPTKSSRASQSSRKATTPMKEKLPPIREASPGCETASDTDDTVRNFPVQDAMPAEQQNQTATPQSTSSSSFTASPNFVQPGTPQTEIFDAPRSAGPLSQPGLSWLEEKLQEMSIQAQLLRRSPAFPLAGHAHAHPQSSIEQAQEWQSPYPIPQPTPKPDGWFWQLDSHGFPCAKHGCEKRCNLWDGATVICPRCGPFSEVRYCSKAHLFEDIKWHWGYCQQLSFQHPCRETSIPRQVRDGPPILPCLHPFDTPERHRQAVHFHSNMRAGDYFIFADWADQVDSNMFFKHLDTRCGNKILHTIQFDDPQEKDRFRRVLAACLFMNISVVDLVDYLYRLIRDKLRATGATPNVEAALQYQFQKELSVQIQSQITGERHACEAEWNGTDRRQCSDILCRSEYRPLLGSHQNKCHRQYLDQLESTYWILRAARTTHPEIRDVHARMMGQGFGGTAEVDRRVYSRGDGWDGFDAKEMEIEGVNT